MSNTIQNDISQVDDYLLTTTYYLLLTLNFHLPLAALLADCTLYERMFGTEIAHAHIYDALWFNTLWGIVFVYACMECIKRKIWKRPFVVLLYVVFVLIAVGYAFTCYHAIRGKLHLRSGITATLYFTDDLRVNPLPMLLHSARRFSPPRFPQRRIASLAAIRWKKNNGNNIEVAPFGDRFTLMTMKAILSPFSDAKNAEK